MSVPDDRLGRSTPDGFGALRRSAGPRRACRLPMHHGRPAAGSGQAGFTLLEVLVAFSILGVALALALNVFSGGLRAATQAEAYQRATAHAQSLLATAQVHPVAEGEATGEFPGGYRWRRTVTPYDWTDPNWLNQAPVRALRISVEVAWGEAPRTRSVQLQGLRLVGRQ